jgi:nucleoside-diphosphate kinase
MIDDDCTFAVLKPDAYERGLVDEIIHDHLEPAFVVVRSSVRVPDAALVEAHYEAHRGKPYFDDLVAFMCSGTCTALVLQRIAAVAGLGEVTTPSQQLRTLMGPYDRSDPNSIRGRFMIPGDTVYRNLIHGADDYASACRESELWFRPVGSI